jgi:hypothetical protein
MIHPAGNGEQKASQPHNGAFFDILTELQQNKKVEGNHNDHDVNL